MATPWGQYPDTILTFVANSPLRIDLRQPMTDADIRAFQAIGFVGAFGIVTACDPLGINQAPAVNHARTRMLQMEIESIAATHATVDACSVDGSHCEASFALAADPAFVTALAIRYDQLGVFWFDGESFWITPARSIRPRLRLPLLP